MNDSNSRLQAWVLGILGTLLFLAGLGELWVGRTAQNVVDLVQPEMTDEGLAQHRSDFETARATFAGVRDEVLPAVADALGGTPEQLEAEVASSYLDAGKLLAEVDEIVPFAQSSLENLERQQSNFEEADSVPISGAPGWSGGIVSTALAGALGGAALLVARGRRLLAVVPVAGAAIVLVALPLALRIPQKSAAAQEVLDSLNPGEAVVTRTENAIQTANAGEKELRTELIPDMAASLGLTEAQFIDTIEREFPETAAGLAQMPEVLDRYEDRLAIRQGGAPDLRTLKDLPIAAFGWFDPIFGAVLGAMAAWIWVAARGRQTKERPASSNTLEEGTP